MAFINENSPVVALPELEVFENIPVQTSIEDTIIEELIPQSQLNTGAHVEFIIKTADNEFIKPMETLLQSRFKVKLRKVDNTAITDADWAKVSLVNNAAHSMWAQIDVSIGESQTTASLQTYPYKAYIDSVIHTSKEAKDTYQKLIGFTDDDFTNDKIHKPDTTRTKLIQPPTTATDKSIGCLCELWTPLNIDLFRQPKDLIGGLTVKLRLIPSRPEFLFMCSDANIIPSIEFEDIYLHVSERTISGDVALGIMQGLMISPAKYPINRCEVRSHTIDRGTMIRNLDNLIIGTMPRKVYVAFTSNAGFGGSYTKNPFYFDNYNISSIACYVNSQMVSRRPQKPDYELPYFTKEYLNFLKVSGQFNNLIQTTITPEKYKTGYTIFAFDLTRDKSGGFLKEGYCDPPKKFSNLRFTVQFNSALTETISAIIFCEWDDLVIIDAMKNAYLGNNN